MILKNLIVFNPELNFKSKFKSSIHSPKIDQVSIKPLTLQILVGSRADETVSG